MVRQKGGLEHALQKGDVEQVACTTGEGAQKYYEGRLERAEQLRGAAHASAERLWAGSKKPGSLNTSVHL